MEGMKVEKLKEFFFDRKKVEDAMNDAERRILGKFSGRVRLIAQRSMKNAPKKTPVALMQKKRKQRKNARPDVLAPGSPPYARTKLLKKNILYAYVPEEHKSFIGPTKLNAKYDGIPGILERGGTETLKTKHGSKSVTYAPRPYMAPALAAETPGFAAAWANSIKG